MLVEAPAGYGKTTFAREWADHDARTVAWVSLGEGDDDPAVLLAYLAEALARARVDVAPVRERMRAGRGRTSRTASALGAAFASAPRPILLVLDDVHLLTRRGCLEVVSALAARVQNDSQLLLTTRRGLDLPAAAGRAAVLRPDDLRFSDGEAAAMLAAAGIRCSPHDAARLNERCEGWPAGLVLAVLALRSAGDEPVRFTGADRTVTDYVRLEVLDPLPPAERELLLHVSVLDRVSQPLAEAALDARGAELPATPFLLPADEPGWFRLHRLVREALRAELDLCEPDAARAVLRRAADWHAGAGDLGRALGCAAECGDPDRVAALAVVGALPALLEGEPIDGWPAIVDDARGLERNPALAVVGAWQHALSGRDAPARRWAEYAFAARPGGTMPDGSPSAAWVAALRALLCTDGAETMAADAGSAIAGLAPNAPLYAPALSLLGFAHVLLGDEGAAERAFAAATEAPTAGAATAWTAAVLAMRALLAARGGERAEAVAFAQSARTLVAGRPEADCPTGAFTHLASARIALDAGARSSARDDIDAAERLVAGLDSLPWAAAVARLELAHLHLGLEGAGHAQTLLEEIGGLDARTGDLGTIPARAEVLRRDIERGSSTGDHWQSVLTPAERRLLPLLATYLSFRQIAERLGVSRNTVKTQAIAVYRKLDVSSRSDAVRRAGFLGIL